MMSAEYQCMLHSSVGWKMQSGGGVWETDQLGNMVTTYTTDLGEEHVTGLVGFLFMTKCIRPKICSLNSLMDLFLVLSSSEKTIWMSKVAD